MPSVPAEKEGVKRATLSDVAAKAGVSIATASNVLNKPEKVTPARRHAVTSAIAELGYRRNEQAASLRKGKTTHPEAEVSEKDRSDSLRDSAEAKPQGTRPENDAQTPMEKIAPVKSIESTWQHLRPGSAVEVRYNAQEVFAGEVDIIMADRSSIWIWISGHGRRLIHATDGIVVVERTEERH